MRSSSGLHYPSQSSLPAVSSTQSIAGNTQRNPSSFTLLQMHSFLYQNPAILHRIEQDYVENIIYDLLFEIAIDVSVFIPFIGS